MSNVSLGDLTKLCCRYPTFYGFDYQSTGVLVLKGENITRDGDLIQVSEPSYITEEINSRFPKTELEVDDLIVSVRGEVGKVGLVPQHLTGSNINANTIRIALLERVKGKEFMPEFLQLYLNSSLGQLLIRQFIAGGVQETITAPEILEVRIPKLHLDIQEKLVVAMGEEKKERRAKLAEADALLASLDDLLLATLGFTPTSEDERKVFAITQERLRAEGRADPGFYHPRYTKLLSKFMACQIPKITLGELSPELVGGATPTRGSTEFYASGGVKFLRILNVKANEFDLSNLNHIKPETHEGELKRSQLNADDVLLTITGRVGNAAVVTPDLLPANINQHIVRLRLCDKRMIPEYLAIFLNSSVGLALSNRGVTGGTRAALDYGTIRALQIPIPTLAVQQTIVDKARRRRGEAYRLRTEAKEGWLAAKRWFEEQLVGSDRP